MSAGRIVLAPHVGYDRVAEALSQWTGPLDVVAGLDGEPVFARWTSRRGAVRWSTVPEIGLKVIEGTGAAELPRLPTVGLGAAARMARSADLAEALWGVTTLGLLDDVAALPLLAAIAAEPSTSAPVRGATELATRRLGTVAVVAGAEHVERRRERHPDRDPVLGLLGPPAARRQALRWFRSDPSGGRRHRRDVVHAGLADDDWEVRWSAVLAAHDLGVADAALPVRRCPFGRGPDAGQRRVLDAVRDVVAHRLAGRTTSMAGAGVVTALLDAPEQGPRAGDEAAFLLVHALRTPMPEPPEGPLHQHLPRGFVEVAAVPHWLGGGGGPVRSVAPERSFAIAARPIVDVPAGDLEERLARAEREAGRPLRLPTAVELEMALRGTDGRRYPWGNGREPGWQRAPSPWGLERPCSGPEWVTLAGRLLALPPARAGLGATPSVATEAGLRLVVAEQAPTD